MQIHELPDVTAIGSGGYFATDNGSQTTKIDYDALAKAIIEQYSASTLAGSAQSVKTALDGIKTDLNVVYGANSIKTLAATDDLLTLDVGMYRVENVLPLNAPSTTYKYGYATKQHRGASGYTYYEFIVGNGNGNNFKRYYGWQYSNSATSIDWIEMAPQSAVDTLNSKTTLEAIPLTANSDVLTISATNTYAIGSLIVFSGWFMFKSDAEIPQGTTLFTIGGNKLFQTRYYMPLYDGKNNFLSGLECRENTNVVRARAGFTPSSAVYYYLSGACCIK